MERNQYSFGWPSPIVFLHMYSKTFVENKIQCGRLIITKKIQKENLLDLLAKNANKFSKIGIITVNVDNMTFVYFSIY